MRGFGAMLIVFYHALRLLSIMKAGPGGDPRQFWVFSKNPFVALIEEGHTSVSMFMVLSGFVFSVAAHGREINYFAFLKNRFLRIYPLYVVVLMIGLAAFPKAYSPDAIEQALLFQANYGDLNMHPFSSMFWAVAVEFQFYLLFPFLHRFIERDGVRWAIACIALFLAFRWLAATVGENPRDVAYWHLLGRLDQFLIGMVG
jgi:peptidoglycan/LPS O-acetylase OafA/YrhL